MKKLVIAGLALMFTAATAVAQGGEAARVVVGRAAAVAPGGATAVAQAVAAHSSGTAGGSEQQQRGQQHIGAEMQDRASVEEEREEMRQRRIRHPSR